MDQVEDVIVTTLESTPANATYWSPKMAERMGLSKTTIGQFWRKFGFMPHRPRSLQAVPDPLFTDKLLDVVGLYLSSPDAAVVL